MSQFTAKVLTNFNHPYLLHELIVSRTFLIKSFIEKLEERVILSDSLLCIGLDPHVGQVSGRTVFDINATHFIML